MLSLSRLACLAALIGLACLPAACGFTPVYGERNGAGVHDALARVDIAPVPDRLGQLLHSGVAARLQPGGAAAAPDYRLEMKPRLEIERGGYRLDDSTTRRRLRLETPFILYAADSGAAVYESTVLQTVTFDAVQSDYATLVAQEAAERRAIRLTAEAISLRLAAFLRRDDQESAAPAGGRTAGRGP